MIPSFRVLAVSTLIFIGGCCSGDKLSGEVEGVGPLIGATAVDVPGVTLEKLDPPGITCEELRSGTKEYYLDANQIDLDGDGDAEIVGTCSYCPDATCYTFPFVLGSDKRPIWVGEEKDYPGNDPGAHTYLAPSGSSAWFATPITTEMFELGFVVWYWDGSQLRVIAQWENDSFEHSIDRTTVDYRVFNSGAHVYQGDEPFWSWTAPRPANPGDPAAAVDLTGQVSEVTASSAVKDLVLEEGRYTFQPGNTIDGKPTTCWQEQVEGLGIGESLLYTFTAPVDLQGLEIATGFQLMNSRQFGDLYDKNGRVTGAMISVNGTVQSTIPIRDWPGYQYIDFPARGVRELEIEITTVAAGSRWEDTAISEVRFWGSTADQAR